MKCLFLFPLLVVLLEAKKQTVSVKGTVVCDKKPQAGTAVELWEADTFDPHDLLKTVKTDKNGKFEVSGSEDETTSISPYVIIKHKCHVKKPKCTRHAEYDVPSKSINAKQAYDMGIVNVAIAPKNKEHC